MCFITIAIISDSHQVGILFPTAVSITMKVRLTWIDRVYVIRYNIINYNVIL